MNDGGPGNDGSSPPAFSLLHTVSALIALLALATNATAAEQTATLRVPGTALVFSGKGLQPPDAEGHFAVGVRLPLPHLRAAHCDTGNLIVGMGTLNKPVDALTQADRDAVRRNTAVYGRLRAAANVGKTVLLPLRNERAYLKVVNGTVLALYCTVSIDERRAP